SVAVAGTRSDIHRLWCSTGCARSVPTSSAPTKTVRSPCGAAGGMSGSKRSGGVASCAVLALDPVPFGVQLVQRGLLHGPTQRRHAPLDGFEASRELVVGAPQGRFRLDAQLSRQVRHGEQ